MDLENAKQETKEKAIEETTKEPKAKLDFKI